MKYEKNYFEKSLLARIIVFTVLTIACVLLATMFFAPYKGLLNVYSASRGSMFQGGYYKWPIVFVVAASLLLYNTMVMGSWAMCKHWHGSNNLCMQAYVFKKMLPWIAAVISFFLPAVSRLCISVEAFNPLTGCIIGLEDHYLEAFRDCVLMNCLLMISLTLLHFTDIPLFGKLNCSIKISAFCISVVLSCVMVYLNLRMQLWLVIPYSFVLATLSIASVIIFKRMNKHVKHI